MKNGLLQNAEKMNKNRKMWKGWQALVQILAVVVVFCTTYMLILPGTTMEKTQICGLEEHSHTDACYTQPQAKLTGCQTAAIVVHQHGNLCQDADGVLICPLTEQTVHIHDNSCYTQEMVLVCVAEHVHSEACVKTEETKTCTLEESQGHTHGEGCFADQTLICELPEMEGHSHGEACFTITEIPCAEPTAEDHAHEEACWQQQNKLICTKQELQLHNHGESCYDPAGNLICTLSVVEEHIHTDACLVIPEDAAPELTCSMQEHIHTEDCYSQEDVIGIEYHCGQSVHAHDDSCYDAEKNLICTVSEHVHEAACAVEELDLTADVETAQQWEDAYGKAAQAQSRAQALLQVAQAQLNYRESEKNVILEDDQLKGYTRYGAKFGMPYADWNTLFASFCVSYTGMDESFPVKTEANEWFLVLEEKNLIQSGTPQSGDLLFFGTDRRGEPGGQLQITAVGILEKRYEKTENMQAASEENPVLEILLKTIQGDIRNTVDYVTVQENTLLGYAVLPEPVKETPALLCALVEHTHEESCFDAETGELICTETEHTHSDACYEEKTEEGKKLICTLAEHVHAESCFDAETGELVCNETEHTHGDSCYEAEQTEDAPQEEDTKVLYQICGLPEHIHSDSCMNQEIGELMCGLGEHTHQESCYATADNIPMMETALLCPMAEHSHAEECRNAETGELTCTAAEHTHSWECYAPAQTSFTYEDDRVVMDVNVVNQKGLPKGLTMEVGSLSEEDEARYTTYAQENSGGQLLEVTGYQIRFFYGGNEILLPDAQVTANLTLKPVSDSQEPEPAEAEEEAALFAATFSRMMRLMAAPMALEPEAEKEQEQESIVVSVLQQNDTEISRSGTATFGGNNTEGSTVSVTMGSSRTVALASETAPTFQVQFYANTPVYVTDDDGEKTGYAASLEIIDTRGAGNGTGGSLPQFGNASSPKTQNGVMKLYLEPYAPTSKDNSSITYKVATTMKLIEIYTADTKTYVPGMTVEEINKLRTNPRYSIEKIWVSQDGGVNFKSYGLSLGWDDEVDVEINDIRSIAFTNNPESANDKQGIILITNDTVIRFEYHLLTDLYTNPANMYDYDITDTLIYSGNKTTSTSKTTVNAANNAGFSEFFLNTTKQGINSAGNYKGSGAKLGFGNDNTNSGMGSEKVGDMYINQYNRASNRAPSYKGLAYGIVTGYNAETDRLIYNSAIAHPDLFNESANVTGKTIYGGQQLNFDRIGDTYTLMAVNGRRSSGNVGEERLNEFFLTEGEDSFTNNFWPMDNLISDSTTGHDIKFGEKEPEKNIKYINTSYTSTTWLTMPTSDDGLLHNSYFGLQYAISFEMDGQYCGPLEYLFYGDDDMWVFLTYPDGKTSRLICDIGGVHSSVGSYTDLWDYIKKGEEGKGKYTLNFFYMERGASGSSCYMAFTLPGVAAVPQDVPDHGTLNVRKEARGESVDNLEYKFRLNLEGEGDIDKYPYIISGAESHTGTVGNGGEFALKANETITIQNLPAGINYTLTELFASGDGETYDVQWTNSSSTSVGGTILSEEIQGGKTETITCTNIALGDLVVGKQVVGVESTDTYTIEVSLADETGAPVSGTFGGTDFVEGRATVELGHTQTKTFTDIPAGTIWTVTEQVPDGFMVSYSVDGENVREATGTIVHKSTVGVTVVNTAGYRLPDTGGMGTNLLYVGSGTVIAAVLWVLYDNRRTNKKRTRSRR